MLLDRTGEIADRWTPAESDLLPEGPVIVPFERLAGTDHAPLGVHLPNDADPRALADDFARLGLISVDFPSFADGRGFSIGTCLRELGYRGRLRATGPVIADQFAYLLECGFDEVSLPDAVAARQPVAQWLARLDHGTLAYQRGRSLRASIPDQRRRAANG